MGNIGRNDPCPCGSGKKYKKCCLQTDTTAINEDNGPEFILGSDTASLRIKYLVQNMDYSEFLRTTEEPALNIERTVLANIVSDCILDGQKAEEILLSWKMKLEETIEKLCSGHSKYFWLFLSRRIFPETHGEHILRTTPYLHHITYNLSLLKYGNRNINNEFVSVPAFSKNLEYVTSEEPYSGEIVDDDSLRKLIMSIDEMSNEKEINDLNIPSTLPKYISPKDVIYIYQIKHLSFEYYMATAQLRRLWKGGKLKVHRKRFAGVSLPKRVEDMVSLYDNRTREYGSTLSAFGSIVSFNEVEEEEQFDKFAIVVPVPNIEKHDIPLVFPDEEFYEGKIKGPVHLPFPHHNFVPTTVSIISFYKKMCIFRWAIDNVFHLSPEEIVTFIIAIARQQQFAWQHNLTARQNFFQRGYRIIPIADVQQRLAELYLGTYHHLFSDISQEEAASSCKKLTDWLTYDEDDFDKINLWERTGVKLILPVEAGIIVDYSAIPAVLSSIFTELSLLAGVNGMLGQIRGDDFENEVEKYLNANIPGFNTWLCHRKLLFSNGFERDIDVSFSFDNILFIVECKAFSVLPAFDRGEPTAIANRKEKLESGLKQVDTLCKLLCNETKGRNFEIQENITHIVSLVASPHPEYIDISSDRYFLTPAIPRVCTPEEIVEFVKQFQIDSYTSKPYIWKLS